MANTDSTHIITHRRYGTSARVNLGERVTTLLDRGELLGHGDRTYVVMTFKNTPPETGPDLSEEFIGYGALNIERIRRGDEFDEVPVRMGPGGTVLDED